MFKNSVTILKGFCLIGIFFFLWGCDSQTEAPQAPKVVSKKIAKAPPSKPTAPQKAAIPKPAPPMQPAKAEQAPAKAEAPPKVAAVPPPAPKKVEPPRAVQPREKTPAAPAAQVKGAETAKAPEVVRDETAEKGEDQPASEQEKAEEKKAEAFQPIYLSDVYDPTGKIDPFLPLYEEEPVVKKEVKAKRKIKRLPLTPLEKVDLSQLKLVGVINAASGNRALVEEASGKGYIVKKGTYIGIHAGRVVEILSDRIVVEEEVETTLGTYELQKRELKINKPPGEM